MRRLLLKALRSLLQRLEHQSGAGIPGQPGAQQVPDGLPKDDPAAYRSKRTRPFAWGTKAEADKLGHDIIQWIEPQCVGALEVVKHQDFLHFIWKAGQEPEQTLLFSLQFPADAPGLLRLLKEPKENPACSYRTQEGKEGSHGFEDSRIGDLR